MADRLPFLSPACPYCATFCGPPEERAAHIRRFHGIEAQLASRSWSQRQWAWVVAHADTVVTLLCAGTILALGLLLGGC